MNLSQTIEIWGGGPGSGCNPQVGRCGRPQGTNAADPALTGMLDSAMKKGGTDENSFVKSVVNEAANRISQAEGIYPKLLQRPIQEIVQDNKLFQEAPTFHGVDRLTHLGKEGVYMQKTPLGLTWPYERATMVVTSHGDANDVVHMTAHWLDDQWFKLKPDEIGKYGISQKQYDSYQEKLKAMRDEWVQRADSALQKLGYEEDTKPPRWFEDSRVATMALTKLSLGSEHEWWATAWDAYVRGGQARERLKTIAPAAYKVADSIHRGAYYAE